MLLLVAVLACTVMTPVNAATNKSKSVEESFWFVVPEGGHSSARIKLTYREYYSIKDGKSVFSKRTRGVLFQRAGATSIPKYGYGILKHSNGKTFSGWKSQDVMYGSPWNAASQYVNTKKCNLFKNHFSKRNIECNSVMQWCGCPDKSSISNTEVEYKIVVGGESI